MKFQLDVDEERAAVPLTFREKVATRVLMLLFLVVYPAKYRHQVTEFMQTLFGEEK